MTQPDTSTLSRDTEQLLVDTARTLADLPAGKVIDLVALLNNHTAQPDTVAAGMLVAAALDRLGNPHEPVTASLIAQRIRIALAGS